MGLPNQFMPQYCYEINYLFVVGLRNPPRAVRHGCITVCGFDRG